MRNDPQRAEGRMPWNTGTAAVAVAQLLVAVASLTALALRVPLDAAVLRGGFGTVVALGALGIALWMVSYRGGQHHDGSNGTSPHAV